MTFSLSAKAEVFLKEHVYLIQAHLRDLKQTNEKLKIYLQEIELYLISSGRHQTPQVAKENIIKFQANLHSAMHLVARASMTISPAGARPYGFESKPEFKKRKDIATGRGQCLREILSITNNEYFLNRNYRNRFVHFDEAIDDWYLRSPSGNSIGFFIGSRDSIGGDGIKDHQIFENFNPKDSNYIFRGEKFNFSQIITDFMTVIDRLCARQKALGKLGITI